jgi:hypothetical protein
MSTCYDDLDDSYNYYCLGGDEFNPECSECLLLAEDEANELRIAMDQDDKAIPSSERFR